ncbi:SseB family protein [Actinomadura luteofluorescens]|uniref:SseB family protein n=1 Tax=Actinomadura luteofluorescens TaxID=46163 RepID=UPI003641EF0A
MERELLRAASNNDHDLFLQTLAATDVLLPVPEDMDFSLRPGRPGFPWQTREVDGSTVVPVFTSPERLAEASGPGTEHIALPFTVALRYWPDHEWLLAINSGSPAGGTVLAQQLPGLATWADQRAAQRMTDRFEPQNDIEQRLFDAARRRDTEAFFKILLGAQVLVPVDAETPWGIVPGDPEFPWRPVRVHGRTSIQIFTSLKWMNEAIGSSRFIMPSLLEMVTAWPDAAWTLVLNPGTPIDASMPGEQVRTLSGPPAPPSAATPPPPAAPSVPVAPAVPADPAAAGPGRHAGPPPVDEPTVPAPAESGRHHAGTPGGTAQPVRPEAVPPPPAHFGEAPVPHPAAPEAGDVPADAPLGPVPGEPGRHLADPSSTAIDPGHIPGPEPPPFTGPRPRLPTPSGPRPAARSNRACPRTPLSLPRRRPADRRCRTRAATRRTCPARPGRKRATPTLTWSARPPRRVVSQSPAFPGLRLRTPGPSTPSRALRTTRATTRRRPPRPAPLHPVRPSVVWRRAFPERRPKAPKPRAPLRTCRTTRDAVSRIRPPPRPTRPLPNPRLRASRRSGPRRVFPATRA